VTADEVGNGLRVTFVNDVTKIKAGVTREQHRKEVRQ
jgi:hypothetical protein